MPRRTLTEIEADLRRWLEKSKIRFSSEFEEDGRVWVLKYMSPRYLSGFLSTKRLVVSSTSGFTWGDGIYASPLSNPYSSMMYGRIGVLGSIPNVDRLVTFDATDRRGTDLYQEWIQQSVFLFNLLTTTIHADRANRLLRNAFRRRFAIDLIFFRPDQHNKNYVRISQDVWFAISDWQGLPSHSPAQRARLSSRVSDCEWVAVVGEEFEASTMQTHFVDLIGPHLHPGGRRMLSDRELAQTLRQLHKSNSSSPPPPKIAHILA